ncbi:ribosomal protein S5 domain 2-type protein [Hyaloraphidium curvatum]|nr:ribosomal protein S5 domain 2-type protein [Hyaloraphidium curvatum]
MSREAMSEVHDMNLADGRYEEITHKLSMLYVIRKTDPELGDLFFAPYVKPGTALVDRIAERREPTLDADGFSLARGSRKSARATVRMIPGDGVVMVNGVPAADHFGEFLSHAEEAVAPLIRTGRVGRYNAWATVRGGGLSGQAQAIKLAVARNLAIHEPALKPVLAEAGMLVADTRQVERKKTGQPGARKKFAWVKR